MNNSIWIINEFTEWVNKGCKSVKELYEKAEGEEKDRLKEKYNTMKMVQGKFEELKNE